MKKHGLYYHYKYGYCIVLKVNKKENTVIVNFDNKKIDPVEINQSDFWKVRFN